jgi:hypothetical protein
MNGRQVKRARRALRAVLAANPPPEPVPTGLLRWWLRLRTFLEGWNLLPPLTVKPEVQPSSYRRIKRRLKGVRICERGHR